MSAWPDLIAFALGLGVAWASGWTTTDLVWSLWLCSLVVGYSMIVWSILEPALELGGYAWTYRATVGEAIAHTDGTGIAFGMAIILVGGLFVLAFFTLHFGGFHYIHSQFLIAFFPIDGERRSASVATYAEVMRRYWWALPSAFLAERSAFLQRTFTAPAEPADVAVTAEAIARRKLANAHKPPGRMLRPYLKVMRMHLLIIAFGAVRAAHLERFAVYAVVYGLYFFPWRLLRSASGGDEPATLTPVASG